MIAEKDATRQSWLDLDLKNARTNGTGAVVMGVLVLPFLNLALLWLVLSPALRFQWAYGPYYLMAYFESAFVGFVLGTANGIAIKLSKRHKPKFAAIICIAGGGYIIHLLFPFVSSIQANLLVSHDTVYWPPGHHLISILPFLWALSLILWGISLFFRKQH